MMLCVFACSAPKATPSANGAKFIFRATVEQIAAATLPEISDVSQCIVVKVNEVVSAPPGFADWTGKSITVAVKEVNKHKPESEQLFFTNGWLYGKSLAVVEVSSGDSGAFSNQQVMEGVAKDQDDEVQKRLKRSELVVSGEVIRIGETVKQNQVSEHNALWTEAIIRIESVEKGTAQNTELVVLFASSGDIMWEDAPKFKPGDKGIWLLRRSAQQDETFSISEQQDIYPIERLEYIRSLLK